MANAHASQPHLPLRHDILSLWGAKHNDLSGDLRNAQAGVRSKSGFGA
jgi:hypothetical protein